MNRYECPDCRSAHDEPAEAALGFRNRCFDCAMHELHRLEIFASVVMQRAA